MQAWLLPTLHTYSNIQRGPWRFKKRTLFLKRRFLSALFSSVSTPQLDKCFLLLDKGTMIRRLEAAFWRKRIDIVYNVG